MLACTVPMQFDGLKGKANCEIQWRSTGGFAGGVEHASVLTPALRHAFSSTLADRTLQLRSRHKRRRAQRPAHRLGSEHGQAVPLPIELVPLGMQHVPHARRAACLCPVLHF